MSPVPEAPASPSKGDRGVGAGPGPPFLLGALALALRGDVCLVLYLPTLLPQLATAAGLAAVAARLQAACEAHARGAPAALRAVWLAPLAFATASLAGGMLALLLPSWAGQVDAWPRWLGLPPEELAPLFLALFVQLAVVTLGLAVGLARRYVTAFALRGAVAREPWAAAVLGALVVLLGVLVTAIQGADQGHLGHVRAHLAWRSGRSEEALARLRILHRGAPRGALADSALYRMGRIQAEQRGQPEAAAGLFRRLLEEHPASPWADDATMRLVRLLLEEGHRDQARPLLTAFGARFPGSPHGGEAGLLLADLLLEAGEAAAARVALEALAGSGAVLRRRDRYPFDIVPVRRLAGQRLHQLAGPESG